MTRDPFQRRYSRFHAGHIAVVVGAPNVDQFFPAAIELVLVISDVGQKIRRPSVRSDKHPLFVVEINDIADVLRSYAALAGKFAWEDQPGGSFERASHAAFLEVFQSRFCGPIVMQLALAKPAIKMSPEIFHVFFMLREHPLHGESAEIRGLPLGGLRRRGSG